MFIFTVNCAFTNLNYFMLTFKLTENKVDLVIMTNMIDERLLEVIVCPRDKSKLTLDKESNQLFCSTCKKRYNITESGIPIFLSNKEKSINK